MIDLKKTLILALGILTLSATSRADGKPDYFIYDDVCTLKFSAKYSEFPGGFDSSVFRTTTVASLTEELAKKGYRVVPVESGDAGFTMELSADAMDDSHGGAARIALYETPEPGLDVTSEESDTNNPGYFDIFWKFAYLGASSDVAAQGLLDQMPNCRLKSTMTEKSFLPGKALDRRTGAVIRMSCALNDVSDGRACDFFQYWSAEKDEFALYRKASMHQVGLGDLRDSLKQVARSYQWGTLPIYFGVGSILPKSLAAVEAWILFFPVLILPDLVLTEPTVLVQNAVISMREGRINRDFSRAEEKTVRLRHRAFEFYSQAVISAHRLSY